MNKYRIHHNYLRNVEEFVSSIEKKITCIDLFTICNTENWINQYRYQSEKIIRKSRFSKKIFSQSYLAPIKEFGGSVFLSFFLIQKFLESEYQSSQHKTFSRMIIKHFYIAINQKGKKKIKRFFGNQPCT